MEPFSELIKMMRSEGAEYNEYPLMVSKVISTSPVTIEYNQTMVSSHIVLPPHMLGLVSPAGITTDENGLKAYLTSIYNAVALKPGDYVFARRVGDMFYILGKAVDA